MKKENYFIYTSLFVISFLFKKHHQISKSSSAFLMSIAKELFFVAKIVAFLLGKKEVLFPDLQMG